MVNEFKEGKITLDNGSGGLSDHFSAILSTASDFVFASVESSIKMSS